MLEAAGRAQEATLAVVAGLKSPDANAAVYRRALALAVKRKRSEDAVAWMEMGASAQKDDDAISMLEADAYEFAGRSADAERVWTSVENRRHRKSRRPGWSRALRWRRAASAIWRERSSSPRSRWARAT